MTREEKIKQYADELAQQYFPDQNNILARENIEAKFVSEACMRMAKWVDKNPKRYSQEELCGIQLEMMKQRDKRLINKAKEWLNKQVDGFRINGVKVDFINKEHFIDSFIKSMENDK